MEPIDGDDKNSLSEEEMALITKEFMEILKRFEMTEFQNDILEFRDVPPDDSSNVVYLDFKKKDKK